MNIIAINKRLATINPAYSAKFSAAPDNTVDDEITILLHRIPTRWALQLGDGYVGINEYKFENGELVASQCHGMFRDLTSAVAKLYTILKRASEK